MYKLCKTEQSAQRQRHLEEGLLELMSVKRYEDITVSDLCDYMQVPRKSFYRYFSSKDGALHALLDHTMMGYEGFHPAYSNGEARSLHRDLTQFFLFWIKHKPLLDALTKSGMSGTLVERAMNHATSDENLPHRFLPGDSLDTRRQVVMFCVSGLMSMILTWHRDGYPQSAEQMATVAVRIIGQPLFPNVEQFF